MKKITTKVIISALVMLPLCFSYAEEDDAKKGTERGRPEAGKGRPEGRPPHGPGGPGGPGGGLPKFEDIDTDGSGDISQAEWTAFHLKNAKERAERSFKFISGGDDKITAEELEEMMKRHRAGRGKGRPGDEKGMKRGKKRLEDAVDGSGQKPKRPAAE